MLPLYANASDLLEHGKAAIASTGIFRGIFFMLTLLRHRRGLQFQEALGRGHRQEAGRGLRGLLIRLYWIGLFICWLFFHGMKPPVV